MTAEKSFEDLVRATRQKAYSFAFRLCGNDADASDLMQEAFVRACRGFESFDHSRPFLPWIFRIIHNLFVNRLKSAESRRTVSFDEISRGNESESASGADSFAARESEPTEALLRKEEDDLMQRALASLEPHYRAALILCDIEGWAYNEIALALTCPIGTVKSRVFIARKKIRAFYEEPDMTRGQS